MEFTYTRSTLKSTPSKELSIVIKMTHGIHHQHERTRIYCFFNSHLQMYSKLGKYVYKFLKKCMTVVCRYPPKS